MGELADAVERRSAAIPFKIQSRVNLMTPEVASALRRAGCTEVWMGVESGSQKILDAMEKGTRVEMAPGRAKTCAGKEFGPASSFSLVTRAKPGKTSKHFDWFARRARMNRRLSLLPLPGTKFYERVRRSGREANWVDSDDFR